MATLGDLPAAGREAARFSGTEVMWPLHRATAAVNALADAGQRVIGLDVRLYDDGGGFFEVAWFVYDGHSVEAARAAALAALERPDLPGDWVLVTWS